MSGSQLKIKQRIRSIQGTQKITKAMELVANAKLARARKQATVGNDYTNGLIELCAMVAANVEGTSRYTVDNGKDHVVVVIGSDLGLCGGYTNALVDEVIKSVDKSTPLWLIGTKGASTYLRHGYHFYHEPLSVDDTENDGFTTVADTLLQAFENQSIGGVEIIYNRYINALTYQSEHVPLLPFEVDQSHPLGQYCEFEPDGLTILDALIPKMIRSNGFEYLKSARRAEYAARRAAMENANKNADEMVNELKLQYNQARQAAITTQISEIVSGSDAIRS